MKLLQRERPKRALIDGTGTGNPYIDAQAVWLERYGSYVTSAYNWRLLAMLEAIALVVAIMGIAYVGGKSKFVPYIVAVDKIGTPINVTLAQSAAPLDQRILRSQLANWIVEARTIVPDRYLERKYLDGVFVMLAGGSAARGYVDSWYRGGHSPFEIAKSQTVEVQVEALLPITPTTWQATWSETIRNLRGEVQSKEEWQATIGIALRPPTDEATIMRNPTGLYITTLAWTKKQ